MFQPSEQKKNNVKSSSERKQNHLCCHTSRMPFQTVNWIHSVRSSTSPYVEHWEQKLENEPVSVFDVGWNVREWGQCWRWDHSNVKISWKVLNMKNLRVTPKYMWSLVKDHLMSIYRWLITVGNDRGQNQYLRTCLLSILHIQLWIMHIYILVEGSIFCSNFSGVRFHSYCSA